MKSVVFCLLFSMIFCGANAQQNYTHKVAYVFLLNGRPVHGAAMLFNSREARFSYVYDMQGKMRVNKPSGESEEADIDDAADGREARLYIHTDRAAGHTLETAVDIYLERAVYVEEPIAQIDWKIGSETKKIGKYTCTKAEGSFGGRAYTVWFTPKIPAFFGPWKLHGLPGLILEAKDSRNQVHFLAKSIANTQEPVAAVRPISRISREEFLANYQKVFENTSRKVNASSERGTKVEMKINNITGVEIYEF